MGPPRRPGGAHGQFLVGSERVRARSRPQSTRSDAGGVEQGSAERSGWTRRAIDRSVRVTRNTEAVRKLKVLLVCALALAIGASGAEAQGQGVTVDPDSPSGKEYAIPLESARRQADPQRGTPTTASRASSAALFGEGVVASTRNEGRSPTRSSERSSEQGPVRIESRIRRRGRVTLTLCPRLSASPLLAQGRLREGSGRRS